MQIAYAASLFLIPFGCAVIWGVINRYYAMMLYTHPAGIKMSLLAIGWTALVAVLYLAIMFCINRALLERGRHEIVALLVRDLLFIFFAIPALLATVAGPAAVEIMDKLGP